MRHTIHMEDDPKAPASLRRATTLALALVAAAFGLVLVFFVKVIARFVMMALG
jgi:hypothetical protein